MLKVILQKNPFLLKFGFSQKMLFSQVYSIGYIRAKRVPRASESSAVYANQANLENKAWSERAKRATRASEPGAVFENQANQAWSERAKRASRASEPSAFSQNQALSFRAKRLSQPIAFLDNYRLRPSSHTGRDDDDDADDDDDEGAKKSFKIAENLI